MLNAMDPRSLGDLQRLARGENSAEALRAAAQQFEAVFMQMVFKSMRDATPQGGMLDSEHTRMFQQLHDQQIASNLAQSGRGTGLADAIFRQLGGEQMARTGNTTIGPDGRTYFDLTDVVRRPANPAVASRTAEKAAVQTEEIAAGTTNDREVVISPSRSQRRVETAVGNEVVISPSQSVPRTAAPLASSAESRVGGFVGKVWEHAAEAGQALGVPARFIVAQAGLETGWGRAELRHADGSPSHNLFNIKAGAGWKGDVVEVPVTEYANGRAYTENARFRAYPSYAEAFDDYVALLRDNPRYAGALHQQKAAGFAAGLVRGGYATDPQYADKLVRVIGGGSLDAAVSRAMQVATSSL